jgi:hypothetical protein
MNSNIGSFSSCNSIETPSLVISKINYNPNSTEFGDISEQEFIEITNNGTSSVDLTGIYFGGTGFVYQFPSNIFLAAGKHLWLANDSTVFHEKYSQSPFGEFTRSLSNGGEELLLLDAFGNIVDEVNYDDKEPWPELADGDGFFLLLNDLNSDNNDPLNWAASVDTLEIATEDILRVSDQRIKKVVIFPNPSNGLATVESTSKISRIQLIDLQGKLIFEAVIDAYSSHLDMHSIKDGVYIIKIILTDQSQLHQRIIKK